MQGDAYLIPIVVRQGDVVIEPEMVETLVLKIGNIAQLYPGGGLTFSKGCWYFALSQEQSLLLPKGKVKTGGRMKLLSQAIVGFRGPDVDIWAAILKGAI